MQTIGRWIWIALALGVAVSTAIVVLPVALFSDPVLRKIGSALASDGIDALVSLLFAPQAAADVAGGLFTLVWIVIVAICVVPAIVVALIGEVAGIRTILWYGIATGCLAGAMPWILRVVRSDRAGERTQDALAQAAEFRLALMFALTGLVAGMVYWLIAGRSAGKARSG